MQVHQLGLAVHEGQHDGAERCLELGVLVQVVEHHVGQRAAFQVDHDPDRFLLVGLVAQVGDAFDDPVLHELRDGLDQARLQRNRHTWTGVTKDRFSRVLSVGASLLGTDVAPDLGGAERAGRSGPLR